MNPIVEVIPPFPVTSVRARGDRELPFPLAEESCILFSRARHALWYGTGAIGLGRGDEVLVPAYHHGSEIEALHRRGLVLRFYPIDERFAPDEAALEELISPRTRAPHLTHVAGYAQDAQRWRSWSDAHGLLMIEDAAQGWLGQTDSGPVGAVGDIAIFCLYKTIGVPDGAALWFRDRRVGPPPAPEGKVGAKAIVRTSLMWAMSRSSLAAAAAEPVLLRPRPYDPAADFYRGNPWSRPSTATTLLLPSLADRRVAAVREQNWHELREAIGSEHTAGLPDLPAGSSPFGLAVEAPDKRELLGRLTRVGVRALDFWSVPHPLLDVARFPRERALREKVVVLPVHQELRPRDIRRVARAVRPAPKAHGAPKTRGDDLEIVGAFDEVRAEHDRLAEASRNLFVTHEWLATWWRHFGKGRALILGVCRRGSGGEVFALLPLYEYARRPIRILRLVGHGHADELPPICDPADVRASVAVASRLLDDVGCELFVAEQIPEHHETADALGGLTYRRESSPVIEFAESGWEGYLSTRSRNFREQARRRERRLAAAGSIRFRLADEESLGTDLDVLFKLHRDRWAGTPSSFAEAEPFHREFAAVALARGWLRMWLLEIDGAAVAAWYGFRYGGSDWYYQAGRDRAWDSAGVGSILLLHTIRDAAEAGARSYRLLQGDEAYKLRFATHDERTESFVVARSARGRAAAAAWTASERGPVARAAASAARRALDRR